MLKHAISCTKAANWMQEHNDGWTSHDVERLTEESANEWIWNCNRCSKTCFVGTEECTPASKLRRNYEVSWYTAQDGVTFCGECAIAAQQQQKEGRHVRGMNHDQVPPPEWCPIIQQNHERLRYK